MATVKQLDDITECPICTEVYTDPRVLPCVRTFCLKCIKTWSNDKQPGDELACPLCKKEFTLPGLKTSFFVSRLLKMRELPSAEGKTSPCGACSGGEESESEVKNVASVYCVECQMKLCHICERGHKAVKLTCSHKLIELGEKASRETLYQILPPSYCDQHKDEILKSYCFDCKMAMCMICYTELHNAHKCSDIDKV